MKKLYFKIFIISCSPAGKLARALVFALVILFVIISNPHLFENRNIDPSLLFRPLALLAFAIINELFLQSLPGTKPVSKAVNHPFEKEDALVYPARARFVLAKNAYGLARSVFNNDSVKFFRKKIGILDMENVDISKDELLKQAEELVVWVKGDYICEVDLFASYLLLCESQTRFLQKNNLSNDDVVNVVFWTRKIFTPDTFSPHKALLIGSGVFDPLCYGWNFELRKYARDLTADVLSSSSLPNILGYEKEFDQLVLSLARKKSANALIVGEEGTGKVSLVDYLAAASFIGTTPPEIAHKKIYELFVDRILSGVSTAGELESRLGAMLIDIMHAGNTIIFVQNIENIFGGGGVGLDVSGVLHEYLASDRIQIIGTTTPVAYADFISPKTSLVDLFEKIELSEPEGGKVMLVLTQKTSEFETKYKISIAYSALKEAVLLSGVYFPDRFFPGKAVDLLEDAASAAHINKKKELTGEDVIALVQSKTNVLLSEPDKAEKELLINLEGALHKRVIGQDEAIKAVADTMRRLRSGFKSEQRPISSFLFLGPTGVGKTETAKALAAEYFGDENAMIRLDMSEYQTQDQLRRILGEEPGQEFIPNTLTDLIQKKPFSLILLDEFEKAHPHLLDIFLQVLDEGRLTDNQGKTVSFKNAIIIATSNAGSEKIREKGESINLISSKKEIIEYLLKNNIFKPELINRFDDVILFKSLNFGQVTHVASMLLSDSSKKLEDNQIKITFDDTVSQSVAKNAYSPEFGARELRRYIEENIESNISKLILSDRIRKGDRLMVSIDKQGALVVT